MNQQNLEIKIDTNITKYNDLYEFRIYSIMFRQLFQVTIQKFMPQTHIGMTTYSAFKFSNHSPKYNRHLHNFH